MGRRNDHSPEMLREMMINAAREIVVSDGVSALSARRVTDRVGYSVGSLYQAFANLDDLIAHLNQQTLLDMHLTMDAALRRGKRNGMPVLKRLGRAYAQFARDNPVLWRLAFEHRMPKGQSPPKATVMQGEALIQLVIEPLAAVTGLSGRNLETVAQVLWSGIHGICILTVTSRMQFVGRTALPTLTDSLIENYLAGVTANKAA